MGLFGVLVILTAIFLTYQAILIIIGVASDVYHVFIKIFAYLLFAYAIIIYVASFGQ